ncbi:hypothetical protein NDU88_005576 [Pleurodeles waltl]|uniref:Uncharacterized protein n=1 Tax=Pleurodeles waltl TaxID=8319 RepID=A0AAV7LLL3_PLEWA|nr:hypothetical protein NDU88_005576 [Pleurodeles waltl]
MRIFPSRTCSFSTAVSAECRVCSAGAPSQLRQRALCHATLATRPATTRPAVSHVRSGTLLREVSAAQRRSDGSPTSYSPAPPECRCRHGSAVKYPAGAEAYLPITLPSASGLLRLLGSAKCVCSEVLYSEGVHSGACPREGERTGKKTVKLHRDEWLPSIDSKIAICRTGCA